HRESKGLAVLKVSYKLTEAAEWMSDDMAERNILPADHKDSLGRTFSQRVSSFGYTLTNGDGENIAYVGPTGENAFDAWLSSTMGHKEQMESTGARTIGIARTKSTTTNNWFWTADFGTILDAEITPAPTSSITEAPTTSPTDTQPTSTPTGVSSPTTNPTITLAATQTPTPTPTSTPTPTPTRTPTPTPTRTPTPTSTPVPTNSPTPTPITVATPTTASTPTSTPTSAPTATSVPTATIAPQATATPTPTIAKPGGIAQTIGLFGGILIIIIGGIFLLVL
ncbi:MAG: CAP domain-containing protein, partial [Candidatus Levybacteria bacterium]|nr:CAP domain-containing protein [Candidatus Levybacteria bacterium]